MCADISNIAAELFSWHNVAGFLNSNFTAALAGALGGALAAQKIGDRAKQREALLQEIRSTNAAIVVTFTICNAGLALKKQFVKEIYETYTAKKEELKEFQQRLATGQQHPNLPFEFQADFRTLQMPVVPIDILRTQVYESISANGRPLALVAALVGAIASLADTIHKRNTLIERFRELGSAGTDQLPAFYFGLPFGPGHVSTEFSDTVESLHSLTDDVIFFSELLGKDLMTHGNHILNQYRRVAKVKKEKISSVDFTEPRRQGLMPDAANYADWLKGFQSAAQQGASADVGADAPPRQS
jgi:hypothetical protein